VEAPTSSAQDPTSQQTGALDEFIEWVGELNLEETDSALVAAPNMRKDPAGGWLYWDNRINQARVYAADGSLEGAFGRAGDGPGEFRRIQSLLRLDDSRLVSVDSRGRVAIWDPRTYELEKDFLSRLSRVVGAVPLTDATLLVLTVPGLDSRDAPEPVLHVLDVAREQVVTSGFTPAVTQQNITAMATVVPPVPRRFGDSIYVALPIFDTIWVLPSAATTLEGRPVPLFSRVASNEPPARIYGSASQPCMAGDSCGVPFRTWVEQSTFAGAFFPLPARRALVHAWAVREGRPLNYYHLLNSSGTKQWEVESSLVLLEVDQNGLLYFWDREDMVPSRIRVAKLR
jgi:hypothetical protein